MRSTRDEIEARGYACLRGLSPSDVDGITRALGVVVGEETIRLRPGAHAYVAKPGPVPLHTDHPRVDLIAWHCVARDRDDGASWLLDARPVIDALDASARATLRETSLACPRLEGGPPCRSHPVLWGDDAHPALFCSPWLHAVDAHPQRQAALDLLRERLSAAAKRRRVSLRLDVGDLLVVDNHRVLHGRGAVADDSPRHLRRLWLQRPEALTRPPMPPAGGC